MHVFPDFAFDILELLFQMLLFSRRQVLLRQWEQQEIFLTAETNVPQVGKTHNEAFVPKSGTVVRGLSEELPLDRIHDSFQAVVGAEFLVDVVKVIAEGLRADTQSVAYLIAILAFGEQAQDMLLLLG